MFSIIEIDCTPIYLKYDYETVTDVCAWAVNTLHKKQQEKWYNRINIFKHFFPSDYNILEKELKKQVEEYANKSNL